jgi:hypothetical protein
MFSMAETRRFGHNIGIQSTEKLNSMLSDLNSLNELTNPQKALKDIIEIELQKRKEVKPIQPLSEIKFWTIEKYGNKDEI